tara:strand:+ start:425 stop:1264 length:840 start_codon:yes stop_codon:yes gene_type:complete
MSITVSNNDLTSLLNAMKRKQTVNGKQQAQVEALLLTATDNTVLATSLTRDLSGLSRFQISAQGMEDDVESFPVPSIDNLLGILKLHGAQVTLTFDEEKNRLRVKSTGKQTTFDSSKDAKAFSHSPDTIREFHMKGIELCNRIEHTDGVYYRTNMGDKIEPIATHRINSTEMYEALRCDTMNGQRLNRYRLGIEHGASHLDVEVGDIHLGQTVTQVGTSLPSTVPWSWQFDGGLDEVFKPFSGDCDLHIFDFREHGQGMRLLVIWPNGCFAFQAGVLVY